MSEAFRSSEIVRMVMRWIMAAFFVAAGVAHLRAPDQLLAITPGWVPYAPQVIFLTGLFEFVASAALVTRPLRYYAGIALALYALAVWPANIKHAFEAIYIAAIPDTWWYHGPRLVAQPFIIWWSLYCADVIDWPFRVKPKSPVVH